MKHLAHALLWLCSVYFTLNGQPSGLFDFVNDTTIITLPGEFTSVSIKNEFVSDQRAIPGTFFAVRQKTKWRFVPVDQYLFFERPLERILNERLSALSSAEPGSRLIIENVSYTYNGSIIFRKGNMLNGYTRLVDSTGNTLRDWQWEIRESRDEKEESRRIGRLVNDWIDQQANLLNRERQIYPVSPFRYRQQLLSWMDMIYLDDGYILDTRLMLDFPADQQERYVRGAPGLYYRKSSLHQSLAFGGFNQQHYFRYKESFLIHLNFTGRIGFNNFNPGKLDYVDPWNILMLNIGLTQTIEYRPRYYRGFFAGLGLHQNINILPEMIDRFEPGLVFSIGVCLP